MTPSQKVELCLASAHFLPARGGATLRFLRYLPGLRERGINVRILTGTPKEKKAVRWEAGIAENGLPEDLRLSSETLENVPIKIVRLPGKAGWPRSIHFSRALLEFCRRSPNPPDIVTVVSSFQPRCLPWIIRLKQTGIKVVYAYTLATELPSNPIKRALRRWSLRTLYSRLDAMLVSSDVIKAMARSLGAATRLEVIPNGVDLKGFRPALDVCERNTIRSSLGLGDGQQMITAIGAVHPRKGIDLLLSAWVSLAKRFPQAHLFVIGLRKDIHYPGMDEFRSSLETMVSASGAADRVHFTGLVGNVEEYLRASDVFVFPSAREGMPNAVLEAMASGLPVVMTPFKGRSEDLGRPGREYLLAERRPDALGAAISKVLEDGGLRASLGGEARKWMEKTMDLERILDRYAAFYHELAAQDRKRRDRS